MLDLDATVLAACEAAFAEQVGWYPAEYPPAFVAMIFFDGTTESKFQDGTEVTAPASFLSGRQAGFARLPFQGDLFRVRGRWFYATEVLPDGAGAVKIRLRLASDAEARRAPMPPVAA